MSSLLDTNTGSKSIVASMAMWLSIYGLVTAFAQVLSEPLGDRGGLRDEIESRFHTGFIHNAVQECV
jgi:hypothetical protein